jgi:AcrR family transcriptional regulator
MKNGHQPIAPLRREQIVDAAVAIIAENGIQSLSLSVLEKRVGMSRGQLTYYFNTKEDIFLAIFDRLLEMLCRQHDRPAAERNSMDWLDILRYFFNLILQETPAHPEFHALHYTFLSQISHRADFRQKLAELYEKWRGQGIEDLQRQFARRPAVRKVSARALSTVMQALFLGLAVQRAADPKAIDPQEIVHLCLDMLGTYLWVAAASPKRRSARKRSPRYRTPLIGEGTSHE